jgi:cytochrome d ubiquinol oxidase subunit I
MKIAASEAQWNTCQPCGFSVFQIGGFSAQHPNPSFSIVIPRVLSFLATGSFNGKVQGLNQLQAQEQAKYGPGNYMPVIELMYWSMRVMAILGVVMFLIAAVGAWLYRKRRLEKARWFLWTAIVAIGFPYVAATFGWILTEMGRQPWIVQNLLKTSQAVSPSTSTAMVATSLGVFVALYVTLGVVDFILMRRYARVDPPEVGEGGGLGADAGAPEPAPALGYGGS